MLEWLKATVRNLEGYTQSVKCARTVIDSAIIRPETDSAWRELAIELETLARHCRLAVDSIQHKRDGSL